MITVSATPCPETRSLNYCIPIKGVVCDEIKTLHIVRVLESTSTVQSGKEIIKCSNVLRIRTDLIMIWIKMNFYNIKKWQK